jgi:hypothetical protein
MVNLNKANRLKDEFVDKLSEVYQALMNIESKPKSIQTDIRVLWRWVKNLLQSKRDGFISDSSSGSKSMTNIRQTTSDKGDLYKDFCENIIKDYYLRDVNELKTFINELLSKNMKNKKRVERIKKLLLTEPQNGSRYSITNDSRSHFNENL